MARKSKPSTDTRTEAERYAALYVGNPRSTGRFNPTNGKMHTDHEEAQPGDYEGHLEGKFGLGLVPILDDDTCAWGAIDIDNHGQEDDIPIAPVDAKIGSIGLPVIPCRSKSGGIHVYVFFDKSWAAGRVRSLLTEVAKLIGYPDAEIFPKQRHLSKQSDGGKQRGNWINLPYFGGDDTMRYAYRNGRKLSLPQFLDWAEDNKFTDAIYSTYQRGQHPEAPPCIQRMLTDGVGKGRRNEALYQITVYTRKAFGDAFKEKAGHFNDIAFEVPLNRAEASRTINSAARPDYRYRCGEEPQKSYCDREACLKRKYGITPDEQTKNEELEGLPVFSGLVKYQSDPIRWELQVDGKTVTNIETEDLLDWRWIRKVVAERLTKVVPMIKNQEWERMLQPLMAEARIVLPPEDASTAGVVRSRLKEFASKAHDLRQNQNVQDRQALLRGLPILAEIDGVKQIVFRQQDFVQYLKRTKSEDLKGVNLWFAVRDLGVQTTRMKVTKERAINVWYIPQKEVEAPEADQIKFESEL